MLGFPLEQQPIRGSNMVPSQYMAPRYDRYEDDYQSYSCYFGLGLGPYYDDCIVDFDFSELVLVVDCCSAVNTDMVVVDTEQWQHRDTDNTTWEPLETDTGVDTFRHNTCLPFFLFAKPPCGFLFIVC